jgi:seryl-tRNA synthetase
LNSERNTISKDISVLMKDKKESEAQALKVKVQNIKQKTADLEKEIVDVEAQLELIMRSIPNVPSADVPIGKDEKDNPEIRKNGNPRVFQFKNLPHWDLAEKNDFVDFERSVKLSGSRFTIYRGNGAKLIRALQ